MRPLKFPLLCLCAIACASAASATSFAVLLQGPDGKSTELEGCLDVQIDDIVWDYKEITLDQAPPEVAKDFAAAAQAKYRLYSPGQPHWGNAKITAACKQGGKNLGAWWNEDPIYVNIDERSIKCTIFLPDATPVRSFTLVDCKPIAFNECAPTADGTEAVTMEVQINGFYFEDPTNNRIRKRPELLYQEWDATLQDYISSAWDNWSGGEPWEKAANIPANKFRTNAPGHKSVGEITLRGAMTDGRKSLCNLINVAATGRYVVPKVLITITDGTMNTAKNKSYNYYDCFPIRYTFPRMSVTNTTGNAMEEVTVKPIRVELK